MEQTYYSSDEELAMGPLTLHEIRKEFQEPRKLVRRRQTDFGHSKFFTPCTTFEEKTSSTENSGYFTPNESLHPEQTNNKNEEFLEKLSKVIEGDHQQETTSFITAANITLTRDTHLRVLESEEEEEGEAPLVITAANTPKDDTLLKILEAEENNENQVLQNVHQTLVENTMRFSCDDKVVLESTIEEISDEEEYSETEDIILISDDSFMDSKLETIEVCTDLVKLEKAETYVIEYHNDISEDSLSSNSSVEEQGEEISEDTSFSEPHQERCERSQESGFCSHDPVSNNPQVDIDYYENDVNEHILSEEDLNQNHSTEVQIQTITDILQSSNLHSQEENDVLNISGLHPLSDEGNKSCSTNYSSEDPAPSIATESDNSLNNSLNFNDTMEEIEMALRQGLDYRMPGDEELIPQSPTVVSQRSGIPKPCFKRPLLKTPNKFDYIQSPVGDYIRKKSPNNDPFKIPMKPGKTPLKNVKQKITKSITSPVGVYIKNSPGVCLKQNVPVTTVPLLKSPRTNEFVKSNKENHLQLPEVIYKPGKQIVALTRKDIVLPSSLQKMVMEPSLTSHEKRVQKTVSRSLIHERLLEGDLTVNDSAILNQSSADVSILKVNQAFIK